MDNNMTIGEMIETYANFGRSREYYNLYKEAVTLDLKVQYALCESYMQECSLDSFLEGSDLWESIKKGARDFWAAIKKFLKNIWFHISRFFHSIFKRSDAWYKKENEYKNNINKVYEYISNKARGGREEPKDLFEKVVASFATKEGYYSKLPSRISDSMSGKRIDKKLWENAFEPKKLVKGELEKGYGASFNNDGTLETYKVGEAGFNKTRNLEDFEITNDSSSLSHGSNMLNICMQKMQLAKNNSVGINNDSKQTDLICKILGYTKVDEKISSFADFLNFTYILCKAPITATIPEVFDIFVKKTDDLNSKLKNVISSENFDQAGTIIEKWWPDVKSKISDEKYFGPVDIIIGADYNNKINKIADTLRDNLNKLEKNMNIGGTDYSDKNLYGKGSGKIGDITVSKRSSDRRDNLFSNYNNESDYTGKLTEKPSVGRSVETMKEVANIFSKVSLGLSGLIGAITMCLEHRVWLSKQLYTIATKSIKEDFT